ncbi:hypothetical protein NKH16_32765 [Mesorhizobium sp. M1307]|uniref:hypothetical protein n=1 Tax=Mesorhizobium sp. M1307 TaxID=2957079 RepID=UPI0033359401
MTVAQRKSLKEFVGKAVSNSKNNMSVLIDPSTGNATFNTVSPGKVPGSYATYEKVVTPDGKSAKFSKKVFDPYGNLISDKDKLEKMSEAKKAASGSDAAQSKKPEVPTGE